MCYQQELDRFLTKAREHIAQLRFALRDIEEHRFDYVAMEHLNKTFALADSISALIKQGFREEAYGLTRTLVEMSVNLRYITSVRDEQEKRCYEFVVFSETDKKLWLYWIGEQNKDTGVPQDVREYAQQHGITPDGRLAFRHWSGLRHFVQTVADAPHPIDESWTEHDRKVARVGDYYHTSCFVHCSQPALDRYFNEDATMLAVTSVQIGVNDFGKRSAILVHQYVRYIMQYCFFGLDITDTASVSFFVDNPIQRVIEGIGDY